VGRCWLAGLSRKRNSGHEFNSGLDEENENKMGNAFMGFRRSAGDRGRCTTAVCGTAVTVRSREREKAGGKREKRLARFLTPRRSFCSGLQRGRRGGAAARQWQRRRKSLVH
jgi:hypothetical protein